MGPKQGVKKWKHNNNHICIQELESMLIVNIRKHLLSSLNICLLVWWRTVFLWWRGVCMPFGHVLFAFLTWFMRLFGFGSLFWYNTHNTTVFHVDIAKERISKNCGTAQWNESRYVLLTIWFLSFFSSFFATVHHWGHCFSIVCMHGSVAVWTKAINA